MIRSCKLLFTLLFLTSFQVSSQNTNEPIQIICPPSYLVGFNFFQTFNHNNSVIQNPKYVIYYLDYKDSLSTFDFRVSYSDFNVEQFYLTISSAMYDKNLFNEKKNHFSSEKNEAISRLYQFSYKAYKKFNKTKDTTIVDIKNFESLYRFCIDSNYLDSYFTTVYTDYLKMKNTKESRLENSKFNLVFVENAKKHPLLLWDKRNFKIILINSERQSIKINMKKGIDKRKIFNLNFLFDYKKGIVYVES